MRAAPVTGPPSIAAGGIVVVPVRPHHLAAITAAVAAALPLAAQGAPTRSPDYVVGVPRARLAVRTGADLPRQRSDIYTFSRSQYTLDRRDLLAVPLAAELGIRLGGRLELVVGAGTAARSADTEYRDFLGTDDLPIAQATSLRRTPLTLGARFDLVPAGRAIGSLAWVPRRVVPWVGAGGGVMNWRFRQSGDFIDFADNGVFEATFTDGGWAPAAYGAAGVDVGLGLRTSLLFDARYTWSRATLAGDFEDFAPIDLSGIALSAGLGIRF